jgi:hypothetical protein
MLEKIKWFLSEWLSTFSNKKSFFSSKRIERFSIFTVMLIMTIIFVGKAMVACTLSATDFMIIVGTWLGYGGWNTTQISKDKKNGDIPNEQESQVLND